MTESHADRDGSFFPGFERISGKAVYDRYFNRLCLVFDKLTEAVVEQGAGSVQPVHERRITHRFLERFLYTVAVLRIKHTYAPGQDLAVDPTDSGFPGHIEISQLQANLLERAERLAQMDDMDAQKRAILDHLIECQEDSPELLWQASQRAFFEMLDPERLFLPFTPGELISTGENGEFRSYLFSWGCFDFATNRPYLHIMVFDQDLGSQPLHEEGENYREFLAEVEREGSRAPKLGVVAVGFDQHLSDIHPKVIKRTCIGPVCMQEFTHEPAPLHDLLNSVAESADDFMALFEDEIIFSARQTRSRSLFSLGTVREVFSIPEADLECYERKVSRVHKYLLLPHSLLQLVLGDPRFDPYRDHRPITYST